MASSEASFFTATSAFSLAFVFGIAVTAVVSANAFLPKKATWQDRFTWKWMVRRILSRAERGHQRVQPSPSSRSPLVVHRTQIFDGLIHFSWEAIFLYYSVFGRTVDTSSGPLVEMGAWLSPPKSPFRDPGIVPQ